MFSKPFFAMFFVAVLAYCGYIVIAGTPLERLNRTCKPFTLWPGNLAMSYMRMTDGNEQDTQEWFDRGFNGCRKYLWNLIYEDDYRRMQQQRVTPSGNENPKQ